MWENGGCYDLNTGAYLQAPVIAYAGATKNLANTPTETYVEMAFGVTFTRDSGLGAGGPGGDYRNVNAVNNWSYMADIYMDLTATGVTGNCARVIMGNQPTLVASNIRSPLNLLSWSNTEIIGGFWKDRFVSGQTAYAHVVTESNGVLNNVYSGTVQ